MEFLSHLSPGLPLIVLSGIAFLLPKTRLRPGYFVTLVLLSWAHMQWAVPLGRVVEVESMGLALTPIRADRIAWIWGTVFHFAALLSAIYAWHPRRSLESVLGLVYAGASIASVFAGDLLTLFTYWELTAISSVFLVWLGGTERSRAAGMRYLLIQVVSGVSLLSAAILTLQSQGDLSFGGLGEVGVMLDQIGTPAGRLMVLALAVKAAFPLLHAWLPDAYPEATPAGAVFLSAFTTKLAVYALLRAFAGWTPLITVGAVMAIMPLIYAVLVDDWRRKLAYCLNNQLGFMVVAVGVGSELAINGVAAHAVAHILYKGLLFMVAGAVLHRYGTARCSELGGVARDLPWVFAAHLVGVAAIALPLFSGFVTKSLSISATAEAHHEVAWLSLLAATAGVFWVCGMQITDEVFLRPPCHGSRLQPLRQVPLPMKLAMLLAAIACVFMGLYPAGLYRMLPVPPDYHPYTLPHIVGQIQLLACAALVYAAARALGMVPIRQGIYLDFNWLYRRPLAQFARGGSRQLLRWTDSAKQRGVEWIGMGWRRLDRVLADDGQRGAFASTGQMAMCSAVMLLIYLIVYYR